MGAKLFLEGKEVPLIGATITSTVGQASIAYIDVVPHNAINDIKPRTKVDIAVRNYNDTTGKYPYVSAWEGEVYGYSFGKQVGSRSFTLSAIDYSSYWDNVLCYFMNTQQLLGSGAMAYLGVGQDSTTAAQQGFKVIPTAGSTASYFKQIIDAVMADPKKDFLDAFVEVYKSISNINDFYNFAEAKLRIRDRMVLHSSEQLNALLNFKDASSWFNGIIGKAGGFQTLRNVVQDLMGLIFHDFVPLPFPARVARDTLEGAPLKSTSSTKTTVGNFAFKPNLFMIQPPMCNVFFPDEYSSFQFNRSFFREPTRLLYKPEMPFFQNGATPLSLPYVFQPESLENFMIGTAAWSHFQSNDKSIAIREGTDPGHFGDTDASAYKASNFGSKKEGQFLTNEELLKGIWMAQEQMMPAATDFQTSFTEAGKRDFCESVAKYLFYKKRFESRTLQITSHLKMSVVPGFNVLLMDDSDADQHVVAYCSSVTHRIYATEGGFTNVTLSYARTVDEQDQTSSIAGEPLIPAWFSQEIFGSTVSGSTSKTAQADVKSLKELVFTPSSKLSDWFATLLGDKGSQSLTDYASGIGNKNEGTLVGATAALREEYRRKREAGAENLQSYIAQVTSRDYLRLEEVLAFIGASLSDPSIDLTTADFTEFTGGAFDPNAADFGFATKTRLVPIDLYIAALKASRGFRG